MTANAKANVEITASSSRLSSMLGAARSKFAGFFGSVNKGFGAIGVKAIGSTIGNALGGVAQRGLDLVVDQAAAVRDFEKNLTRFRIAAGGSAESMDQMRASVRAISHETAISDAEILAGAQTYVDLTGDVDGAKGAMRSFARIAQASGSSVQDIATATASLQDAMQLDPRDTEKVFSGLITQGKAGAVSLKDFAGLLTSLAPKFAHFGGSGVLGIAELGAALQVTRKGFGSASEAATGLESLIGALSSSTTVKQLEKAGVHVFTKDAKTGVKTMRNFTDIIDAIGESKLMKDPTKLGKAFGRKEALAAFQALNEHRQLFADLTKQGEDYGAVQRDLGTYMESSSGKLDKAWNNIKLAIAEAMTPDRIAAFVSGIESAVKAVEPLVAGVTSVASGLYSAGAAVRGFLDPSSMQKQASLPDMLLVNAGRADEATKGRVKEVERFNAVVDKITATGGGPAAIQAAMAAKYGVGEEFGRGKGGQGAMQAGDTYLGNVGFKDPVEVIKETNRLMRELIAVNAANMSIKLATEPFVKATPRIPSARIEAMTHG